MYKRDYLVVTFENGETDKYRVKVGCPNDKAQAEIERKTGMKVVN